jgi:hypothetical protein
MSPNNQATPAAVISEVPYISSGDVVTQGGTDYYVWEIDRAQNMDLIRLNDLKDGFRANVVKHRVKTVRKATEEERESVFDMKHKQFEAEAAYRPGALVKANKASRHVEADALYVITKISAKSVSIVILGGTSTGQYVNAPRGLLDIIKPEDVLK